MVTPVNVRAHVFVQQRRVEVLEGFGRVGLRRSTEVSALGGIDASETDRDLIRAENYCLASLATIKYMITNLWVQALGTSYDAE